MHVCIKTSSDQLLNVKIHLSKLCCQSCLACTKQLGQDLTWASVFVLWCKQEVEPSNA